MPKARLAIFAPAVLAVALAGCGSSSKKSPSSAAQGPPASTSAASAALISTKHNAKLGTILAYGSKHLTVYLFEADKAGKSNCTGACPSTWPPVTGTPRAQGAAMAADLGTVTRPNGTKQVTYKGHPLYLYTRDKDNGDAYGEALKQFGAEWYALRPTGNKVDLS
jgi:predicted lipoprotein with Yx(FWY)xxD motif